MVDCITKGRTLAANWTDRVNVTAIISVTSLLYLRLHPAIVSDNQMTIVFSILIGISMMTHVAFGSYSKSFSNINSSVVETFLMFMGIFEYKYQNMLSKLWVT